jgi:hypothetical protein
MEILASINKVEQKEPVKEPLGEKDEPVDEPTKEAITEPQKRKVNILVYIIPVILIAVIGGLLGAKRLNKKRLT